MNFQTVNDTSSHSLANRPSCLTSTKNHGHRPIADSMINQQTEFVYSWCDQRKQK